MPTMGSEQKKMVATAEIVENGSERLDQPRPPYLEAHVLHNVKFCKTCRRLNF